MKRNGSSRVAVIVRAFNEEKYLPGLLEALQNQSLKDFSVVLVDSGSLDKTREIAARFTDHVVRISPHDFTFGFSLNQGIRYAAEKIGAEIACIVSAHTKPVSEDWLERLIEPFSRSQMTAMVYGRQLGWSTSKFSELLDFERTFGLRPLKLEPPKYFANNANSAVRISHWKENPFDETLTGLEDIAWAKLQMEKNQEVLYQPLAAIYHIHEETWGQIQRRYYREAVAAKKIGIKSAIHSFFEFFREVTWLFTDFAVAAGQRRAPSTFVEIFQFRLAKTLGSVRGLWGSHSLDTRAEREAVFYDKGCDAVVIHGPEDARFDRIELPEMKPGDVLIRVAYQAVCATDLEVFEGSLGYYKSGLGQYPIVPGHEFSGTVVSVGPNVSHLREGDSVVVECIQSCGHCIECKRENEIGCSERSEVGVIRKNGGYSRFVLSAGRFAHKLPQGIDLRFAALVEPLAVTVKGVKRLERTWNNDAAPRKVAVVGAGSLGHICAKVLSSKGHEVVVFDRNPSRCSYFIGTKIHTEGELAHLDRFDSIVEVTGSKDVLEMVLKGSRAGASILLLGFPYGAMAFNFEDIVGYDRVILGSVGSGSKDFDEAIAILPKLDLQHYVKAIYPLEKFELAWKDFRSQKNLKVLLEVDRA